MKAKKTIRIQKLIEDINYQLSNIEWSKEQREVLIAMLDKWLIENRAYAGFRYLCKNEVMGGYKAGINAKTTDITSEMDVADLYRDTDETRVKFFVN
jgi:hypothetical protein